MGEYFTKSIIGIIILIIIGYGMIKGGKVYEWFIEGAKDGLKVCVNIFPYLLAMIVAVEMFKSANLLDMLNNILSPAAAIIGIPREIRLTKLRSNNPISPQLTDPIKTIISDSLSNMFNLHNLYHSF